MSSSHKLKNIIFLTRFRVQAVPVMYTDAFYIYLKYCRSVLSIICLYKVLLYYYYYYCAHLVEVKNELI